MSSHVPSICARTILLVAMMTSLARADESLTSAGITTTWGGGALSYADPTMHTFAAWGVAWGGNVTLGSRRYLAFDAALVGSNAPLAQRGELDSITIQAAVRLALRPRAAWTPYVLFGLGVRKADVVEGAPESMPTGFHSTALTTPVGAGVHIRLSPPLVLDLRATYRVEPESALDAWEARASVGLEL